MGKKSKKQKETAESESPTAAAAPVPASPTYGSSAPVLHVRRNAYLEADRKCRDILCTILFAVFWAGMVTICLVAYRNGNVDALIYPVDHNGQLCNASYPNAFYPHPIQDSQRSSAYYAICVDACPLKGQDVAGTPSSFDTTDVFHRCVPTNMTQVGDDAADAFSGVIGNASSAFKYIARYVDDIRKTWQPIVGFGVGVGFAGCVVWLGLLRLAPGVVVWGSLFVSLGTIFLATGLAASQARLVQSDQLDQLQASLQLQQVAGQETTFKYITIGLLVVDAILLLLVVFMFSRIRLAVGIIQEASKSITHLPSLLLFPVAPLVALLGLFAYFVVSSLYIASCGNLSLAQLQAVYDPQSAATNGTTANAMKYLFAYNVLGVFWTQQLIDAVTVCTIAGAVSRFYWSDSRDQLGFAVATSWVYCFRYSFGSLVFGAAIVAIVQFFRVLLEYIDQQTKHTQTSLVKVVVCCCRACLWCLHKVVKFLSRNGYILVAMKGGSFCASVVDAFQLVAANLLRIGTLGIVSNFVIFMGKLLLTTGCSILVYWFVAVKSDYEISSPFPPLVVTAILAYATASFFLGVFEIAIDTILLSICEDEKINRATASYYASDALRGFLDHSASHAFLHHKDLEDAKRTDVRV
ncbi:Aste57867_1146 [Aphanomyces stellatus]|uniref:Choline transporter-like protein n=1 Tax=Aphanomyces stellatus TaxID=120398 RepID=A0A485K5J2_9STRA|nr:hypothetical protein As57867_001145 [Aphanomyces stellatus]VFT78366.1 Aste57867_1146 [Aphanomyces stellatus]